MAKFIYKRKFYNNILIKRFIALSVRATHFFDGRKDKRICGCSLVKYVPSLYRETMGATGSESTCYWALDKILKSVSFDESDSFIDVGCGKGRILAYLAGRKCPCPLTGIELNKEVYEYAENWAKAYPQISLINGNAFEQDYNKYTVMFLARPFETETFKQFADYLEKNLTHKIRLIYWWDTQSGSYLENRAGWKMMEREWIFTSHGLFMYHWPQRYTIWEYTPTA
ncbi:MAG: class I SAM-dependent methyltransferase [Ruminococcus sp.]|nr:class I SAM-dependent methyltransferase [Ruminococcus sp.]